MPKLYACIVACLSVTLIYAQESVNVGSYQSCPTHYEELLSDDYRIRNDDVLNERLVDLVNCYSTDTVVSMKRQWHRVPLGFALSWIGYYWEVVDYHKYKFVGTSEWNSIPSKARLKEYDINYNLKPHLHKYIDFSWAGRQAQLRKGRVDADKLNKAPFVPPTAESGYALHCECTPIAGSLRDSLDKYFYPTHRGHQLEEHPAMKDATPTMGLYGTWILDCNHSCHPEIHPYEWIWWLDLAGAPRRSGMQEATDRRRPPSRRAWYVGYMRDMAGRQRNWVKHKRTGAISIPFAINVSNSFYSTLSLEPLVVGKLKEVKAHELPEGFKPLDFAQKTIDCLDSEGNVLTHLTLMNMFGAEGNKLNWRLSDLNYDAERYILTGRLELFMSVKDVCTFRVVNE